MSMIYLKKLIATANAHTTSTACAFMMGERIADGVLRRMSAGRFYGRHVSYKPDARTAKKQEQPMV